MPQLRADHRLQRQLRVLGLSDLDERLDRLEAYMSQAHRWAHALDVFAWRDANETIAILREREAA